MKNRQPETKKITFEIEVSESMLPNRSTLNDLASGSIFRNATNKAVYVKGGNTSYKGNKLVFCYPLVCSLDCPSIVQLEKMILFDGKQFFDSLHVKKKKTAFSRQKLSSLPKGSFFLNENVGGLYLKAEQFCFDYECNSFVATCYQLILDGLPSVNVNEGFVFPGEVEATPVELHISDIKYTKGE